MYNGYHQHQTALRNIGVLETWFMGQHVYVSKGRNPNAKRGLTK
jgi:hypothetical protein